MFAHELGQLIVDDLDHGLARRQALQHFAALGAFLDVGDEVLDHGQRDVSLKQGHAHLAHRFLDVLFSQSRLSAQGFDDLLEPSGQIFKHGYSGWYVRKHGVSAA